MAPKKVARDIEICPKRFLVKTSPNPTVVMVIKMYQMD